MLFNCIYSIFTKNKDKNTDTQNDNKYQSFSSITSTRTTNDLRRSLIKHQTIYNVDHK
jgi:hypothetical protein